MKEKTNVLIPYREENTKSSLSDLFSLDERKTLSELMMNKIINELQDMDLINQIYIVSPDFNEEIMESKIYESPVELNTALESAISDLGLPVLIIPSDIPLINRNDVLNLLNKEENVVLSPGEEGGTNALFLNKIIPLRFSGRSFFRHLSYLMEYRINHFIYSSYNLYNDLDTERDILDIYRELSQGDKLKEWLGKNVDLNKLRKYEKKI